MGLIQAPVEQVVAALLDWHGSLGTSYVRRDVTASLADAFDALPPLSHEKRRRLFVATTAGWTACFQSGIDGSDPVPATSHLARLLHVLGMRACSTPPGTQWPATIWEVYAPIELGGIPPLGYRRSVSAANDGGRWSFDQSGEPFPFERLDCYALPRRRGRFTRELLAEYLAEFGLDPFSDSFYRVSVDSPAVVLDSTTRWPEPAPEYTLDEVIAGVPWVHS
jgi:hypothetical protein